jgi:hypothetical protein
MVIRVQSQPLKPVSVVISNKMLEGFSIESIQPQPDRSLGTSKGLQLDSQTDDKGQVTFYINWRSEGVGLFESAIAVNGGGHIPVTQFIYP